MLSVFGLARKSLARLAFALTVAALAACAPGAPGGPGIDTSRAVPVALLVPSGSGQAGDEVLATSLVNAARLAIADLGEVKIDLRVYPTAGLPEQAKAMAEKAATEGAKIILGPVFAQEANAAGLAVAGRGINVLSFSNNTDVAGGNVFVLGPTFRNTANRLASYAVRNGASKIMVAYDQNPAGEAGRAAIQAAVAAAGGTLVADAGYEFSQNGIVNAVPGLTLTARDSGAQAMFLTADTAGALPLLTQLLRDNGLDPEAIRFVGLTRWDIPPSTLALPGVQGGWFALPDPALYSQYQTRYQAAYGEPAHPISGLAYDGIAAIGALIKSGNAAGLTTAGLTQGSGFVGVNGIFRLLPDGTNERGLAVALISDNQLAVIDPAPRAFGGAGF